MSIERSTAASGVRRRAVVAMTSLGLTFFTRETVMGS